MIWNGNVLMQKKLIRKIIEKWHLIFVITNATRSNNFVLSMKTWIERTNEASIVRADTASYRLQFFANNHFHASVYNNDFM